MTSLTDNEILIILMMIGILILAGCVMEITPNIGILAPVMLSLAQEVGMNEINFCIMMVTSLGVGFITPPLCLNLFCGLRFNRGTNIKSSGQSSALRVRPGLCGAHARLYASTFALGN